MHRSIGLACGARCKSFGLLSSAHGERSIAFRPPYSQSSEMYRQTLARLHRTRNLAFVAYQSEYPGSRSSHPKLQ